FIRQAAGTLGRGGSAALAGGRTAAALGARAGESRTRGSHGGAPGGRGGGRRGACRRGAVVSLADGARAQMSDLALAAFAAETGTHVVREPKERRFERFRRAFDPERFGASLAAKGLRFVGRSDAGFPPLLRELHDPPPGLFLRGSPDRGLLAQPAVAIVGARACSSYGAQVARLLGRELASAGLVVVSGLARGVDGEAHRGALEAGGGTGAVLG